jgi:hypothetical protein
MELNGRIVYANGAAAPGVRVRVFDQDDPGKDDDDLTLYPGTSDAHGRFGVTFDPGRFLDFSKVSLLGMGKFYLPDVSDRYLPYVRFDYSFNGQDCQHITPLALFQSEFSLPQALPHQFLPSQHGFQFPNAFPGYPLPFSLPFMPQGARVTSVYGLCGGMSSAASDFFLAGRPVPALTEAPKRGTRLHGYLYRRAIDTFAFGRSIARFAEWMALPDDTPLGVQRLTLDSFDEVRARLDDHQLVVLGLVYDRGSGLKEVLKRIWNNHQVLAYGCTANPDDSFAIHIYDPNYPVLDDIILHLTRHNGGLACVQRRASQDLRPVRGFFAMPYEPLDPPLNL